MATLEQLKSEPWWGREYIPPALGVLRGKLLAHWNIPGSWIGIRGDESHLSGYHRSREWILNSRYCTNDTYSVSRTPGDRAGGDPRWVCGVDIKLPQAQLLVVCQRLDRTVRSGQLEKVTEWYGNINGDTRVDGYDNIANRLATSTVDHLQHLHISFDRGRAGDSHNDIYTILTEGDNDVGTLEQPQESYLYNASSVIGNFASGNTSAPVIDGSGNHGVRDMPLVATLLDAASKVDELHERPAVDPVEFVQALVGNETALDALATAVASRVGMIPTAEEIARATADKLHDRLQS